MMQKLADFVQSPEPVTDPDSVANLLCCLANHDLLWSDMLNASSPTSKERCWQRDTTCCEMNMLQFGLKT